MKKPFEVISLYPPHDYTLHGAIVRILQPPDVRVRLLGRAFEPLADTPEQFAAFIRAETAKWAKVVKAAGIRAE